MRLLAGLNSMLLGWGLLVWGANAQQVPWHLDSPELNPKAAPAATNVWGVQPGPHKVVVALIDSGVLPEHPALEGRLLPGFDMQSGINNLRGQRSERFEPEPANLSCRDRAVSPIYRTHGTEVASLIAGNGHDNVWGVNPQAQIVPIRVVGPCPMTRRDIHDAMAWAAGFDVPGVPPNPNPAHIINISFSGGGFTCAASTQVLVDRILSQGIFIVAAGGNTFGKRLQEPANCKGVISVGAVNALLELESYSALDERTTLYAPGGGPKLERLEPWAINRLRVATEVVPRFAPVQLKGEDRGVGSSFAAPIVSGFLALLKSVRPDFGPPDFGARIGEFTRQLEVDLQNGECPCFIRTLYLQKRDEWEL
jgi:serine protease